MEPILNSIEHQTCSSIDFLHKPSPVKGNKSSRSVESVQIVSLGQISIMSMTSAFKRKFTTTDLLLPHESQDKLDGVMDVKPIQEDRQYRSSFHVKKVKVTLKSNDHFMEEEQCLQFNKLRLDPSQLSIVSSIHRNLSRSCSHLYEIDSIEQELDVFASNNESRAYSCRTTATTTTRSSGTPSSLHHSCYLDFQDIHSE